MKKILITGVAGFLGSNLANFLIEKNYEVIGIDNLIGGDLDNINKKVSIIRSDITQVKCDAIVNAANVTLLGGSGIDGVIHRAAGLELKNKCKKFPVKEILKGEKLRCYPGECKVTDTDQCKLNCRFVFHTVGPKVEDKTMLDYYAMYVCMLAC